MTTITTNIAEDANASIVPGSSAVLNNYGRTGIPAQLNGEGLERTPYMNAAGMAKQDVVMPSGRTWSEPGAPYSGDTSGVLWQSKHGGSYIEIGGGLSEFISIVHQSGARVTIANDGSITIRSGSDIAIVSDANSIDIADGSKEAKYGAGYQVNVSGGKTVITSSAGIDLVSGADINLLAGGAINLNAGNGIDISSTRLALSAKVDTLDLHAEGKLSITGMTDMHIKSTELMSLSNTNMDLKIGESLKLQADEAHVKGSTKLVLNGNKVSLKGSTIAATASGEIHLNSTVAADDPDEPGDTLAANISALTSPPPHVVDVDITIPYASGGITGADVDDV